MKLAHYKKKKISPLDLLSKVTKPDRISQQFDFMCPSLPQTRQNKIERYNTQPKNDQLPDISNQYINEQPQQIKRQQKFNSQINNKLTSLKSESQKFRYYSVQKQIVKKSPYYLQINQHNHQKSQYSINSKIRRRKQLIKQTKPQLLPLNNIKKNKNVKDIKWKLNTEINLKQMFISHSQKIKQIYNSLQKQVKMHEQIIETIKEYILEENNSSQIENIYLDQESRMIIRKIIYLQRILMLCLTETIVAKKYLMHHHNFQSIFQIYLQIYNYIYSDLVEQIHLQNERLLENITINNKKFSFHNAHVSIQSKLKIILRHSKWLNGILQKQLHKLHLSSPNILYYKLLQRFSLSLLHEDCTNWKIQFLQTCPSPYLHYQSQKQYTLVLDLDQTLIHYKVSSSYNGQFLIRPYLYEFLQNLSFYYQIGIFTCSLPEYADLILNHLQHISFRLYRHHTIQINGQFVKDLSRIGRDLSKLILVDNLDKNFRLQKQNGIHIKSWYGDRKDNWLTKLETVLQQIVKNKVQDIRLSKHQRSFL